MKKTEVFRQGDVFLVKVDSVPEGAKRISEGEEYVLAEGEATGHCHTLISSVGQAIIEEHGENVFATLSAPAVVTHQEHDDINLPTGIFKVNRQREYTPEEIRNVAD